MGINVHVNDEMILDSFLAFGEKQIAYDDRRLLTFNKSRKLHGQGNISLGLLALETFHGHLRDL